ncbi:NADP-dependent oxidoreductase [Rhodococcus tukisamuensis]|uniref:NADPH:quinone reductase n=1 Tax=Rhodococcus tukisamuensis TaxID=168276 RepID=A0A1G6SH99_9NOCA|nr:NADP-dependent oxidoreductase [Rhodococcus tukisamuensis]SDD16218.1 NADPH:quinone reductase [Rhodococcus tukisamuensis]
MTHTVVAPEFGGPEVLTVIDEQVPPPGPGRVQVEVRAAGVNPADYKMYNGAFGTDPRSLPVRPGIEVSGVVVAVGDDGPFRVGDEVIAYTGTGGYTERLNVAATDVLAKPAALPWEQAAGLLTTGGTAVDALTTTAVTAGDTVLIHGASGGVGSLAVQLAVARGATVIGTARASNHSYLRELGAVPVEYGDGLADRLRAAAPDGFDAAVDTVGTDEAVDASLELVADRGRIVTIAAFGRAEQDGFPAIGGGTPESARIRREARAGLVDLAGQGKLVVQVAKTFPLADAARAHTELAAPHPRGKFVLLP